MLLQGPDLDVVDLLTRIIQFLVSFLYINLEEFIDFSKKVNFVALITNFLSSCF